MLADPTKPCYDKVALLIGNRHYHHSRLKLNTPETDTQDLAGILRSAEFKVVSLVNLTKQEMDQVMASDTALCTLHSVTTHYSSLLPHNSSPHYSLFTHHHSR